jgi:hypothetical protein
LTDGSLNQLKKKLSYLNQLLSWIITRTEIHQALLSLFSLLTKKLTVKMPVKDSRVLILVNLNPDNQTKTIVIVSHLIVFLLTCAKCYPIIGHIGLSGWGPRNYCQTSPAINGCTALVTQFIKLTEIILKPWCHLMS